MRPVERMDSVFERVFSLGNHGYSLFSWLQVEGKVKRQDDKLLKSIPDTVKERALEHGVSLLEIILQSAAQLVK